MGARNKTWNIDFISIEGTTLIFTNRFLNHDIYDALIFSGKIGFLRYESQQQIQDVFQKIKYHNYSLKYIAELWVGNDINEIPKNTIPHYQLLARDEKLLLNEISIIMKKLKDEFEFEILT